MDSKIFTELLTVTGDNPSGHALAKKLVKQGVKSVADLRKATIFDTLPKIMQTRVIYPTTSAPLKEAKSVIKEVKQRLRFSIKGKVLSFPTVVVGSIRRQKEKVKDFDLLVVLPDRKMIDRVLQASFLKKSKSADALQLVDVFASGTRRLSGIVRKNGKNYHLDLFVTTEKEKPFALFHFTGNYLFNIRVRAHAKANGYKLNQYGLFDIKTGKRVKNSSSIRSEKDLSNFLGVTYRAPKERSEE